MSLPYAILQGDCIDGLNSLNDATFDCCVTSPPYWGLRNYGINGQLGLERTPQEYVSSLVGIFREVKRVLRDDGTLWLNIGDSYAGSMKGYLGEGRWSPRTGTKQGTNTGSIGTPPVKASQIGLKSKDLVGIPWMLAFALREDGWYLRSEIIWHKPNVMPESVKDRPTKAHETIFLLSKSQKYYFDSKAIAEPVKTGWHGSSFTNPRDLLLHPTTSKKKRVESTTRNKRDVWSVNLKPFKGAHFATYPEELIEPCILAGSKRGGMVLDPFSGAGTTGVVALKKCRRYVGIELNPDYVKISEDRIRKLLETTSSEAFQLREKAGLSPESDLSPPT